MSDGIVNSMKGREPYVIAETAYIHEGDIGYLKALVGNVISAEAADALKYHIMIEMDDYMTRDHPVYPKLKNMLFSKVQWKEILGWAVSAGLQNIVLADDKKALDFVRENSRQIAAVELHAIALNNVEMLEKVKAIGLPIILGIGGSRIEDIEFALDYLKGSNILLMHGFQNYPTDYRYINLERMRKVKEKFNLPVGYADHTEWNSGFNEMATLAGFIYGANIIEKHVAIEPGVKRVDFEAAIGIGQLAEIRRRMRILDDMRGDGSFQISQYENVYARKGPMKFTLVAAEMIRQGDILTKDNVIFKRTATENDIEQREYLVLLGREASRDIMKDEMINWSKVK